jgi:hypothetical protein
MRGGETVGKNELSADVESGKAMKTGRREEKV